MDSVIFSSFFIYLSQNEDSATAGVPLYRYLQAAGANKKSSLFRRRWAALFRLIKTPAL